MGGGAARGTIAVGTSGWVYDSWRGSFYPRELPQTRWFEHYAARFPTVEVNYSFYRLPAPSTVQGWRSKAPPGFRFALKGSRFVTHVRRMARCEAEVRNFVDRVRPLHGSLHVVLWQLPPSFQVDLPALAMFLEALPGGVRHAMEFRHESWLRREIFEILRSHDVALVLTSSQRMPRLFETTATFVYARFHGLGAGFAHDYSAEELRPWVEFLEETRERGLDAYVYFNNDALGMAPKNAAELVGMLGGAAAEWGGGQLALGA